MILDVYKPSLKSKSGSASEKKVYAGPAVGRASQLNLIKF